ncbi:putative membrane protein [Edaphobacter aggregans]|uniref:Putative membrane protein n=1 Tax=Edaphobacter aggregans TaxID=570835 RepID=A0A428MF82_9BACT|nr:glutamine amidotransferase [Edaphobacter aggregans]RSL15537.1 putative membrane protein [Edaphobacter aggregans]
MFEFFFKYPITVFTKGRLVLLGAWPGWVLLLLIVASVAGLGWLIRSRLPEAAPKMQTWRAGVVWLLQSLLVTLVLVLLWQPAITVAELKSQQNLIAVLVDDSRSMAIADSGGDGKTAREAAAIRSLNEGILAGLQQRFQTRVYRMDSRIARVEKVDGMQATASATHINDGLKQLVAETADLPVGAVVLLSDGGENNGGIDLETISSLRNRRLPVHTVGFGKEQAGHDVEMDDVSVASRALADSRMKATVSFHQRGYAGGKTTLVVKDGNKALASKDVTLGADGAIQAETVFFNAGTAGVKQVQFSLEPLGGEENVANNATARLVSVSGDRRRILYVEGEPRWEYKFIRRAAEDDHSMQIVSMLRTTENKIYRQGISDPGELADGFPVKAEDLFRYDGIIIGSVEAGYFTPRQQELLREFVDRRGGGLLFLGGRFALADGGWGASSVTELLPTFLPNGKNTFHRDPATAQLTAAGADSAVMRLLDDPTKNVERWKKLPYMMDYQDAGSPKPGATVLAEMNVGRARLPLLVTQNYGRGRTAVMATSGTWRWQMSQALGDPTHDMFWQQLLRWVAADSPGRVMASMPVQRLMDDGRVRLTATVRDKEYVPAPDARVVAHVIGPEGTSALVDMRPVPDNAGTFQAEWTAEKPGSYVTEVTAGRGADELGRDVLTFERTDGVAENFHTEQNRELLEKLSSQTGGRYWKADELGRLPREISYSEAGISVRDTKELWNMPIVFLLLLGLMSGQWMLRRKWGVI